MIKQESHNRNRRKIQCNIHGNRIRYKCMAENCSLPYFCAESECFDQHFHDSKSLICSKFDANQWQAKLKEVEDVMSKQNLVAKQEYLTKIVACFASSLTQIHKEMNELQGIKQEIRENATQPFPFQKIERFLQLGGQVERRIDHLRSKIIDEDRYFLNKYQKQVAKPQSKVRQPTKQVIPCLKNEVIVNDTSNKYNSSFTKQIPSNKQSIFRDNRLKDFLTALINNLSWQKAQIVFNSTSALTNCQRFHEHLKGRKNLLFLFVGQNEVIGSYYSIPYPSVIEKYKKDVNSFIFMYKKNAEQVKDKFIVFFANKMSESHLTISQKLLICHGNTTNYGDGIRTFKRTFESLSYYLPSLSYSSSNSQQQTAYSGVLKIKQYFILQLNLE